MHRPDLIEWADAYFLGKGGEFTKRKTFGCPAYYLGKKMAVFVHEDSLVIKVGAAEAAKRVKMDEDVYGYFSPAGKALAGWLTITLPEASDYDEFTDLIDEGVSFVAGAR